MSNEVPEGWTITTLGQICSKPQYGWTCRGTKIGNLRYIRTTDISDGIIDWASVPYCENPPEDIKKYKIKHNDILVSRAGSVGVSLRISDVPYDAVFASYLIRFNTLDTVDPRYIEFFLKSKDYWRSISEFTAGIAVPNVNASKLASLKLPLAPLKEQRRIVAKLDNLIGKVKLSQNRLKKISVILKRFRQSVIAAACSGRLTADLREDISLDNDLPATWKLTKLEDLCELITKGASPKWQGVNYSDKGVLFVTSENVGAGNLLLNTKKYVESKINEIQPRSILRKGDLLTNIVGASIGRSAIFDLDDVANINQAVALMRLKNGIDRQYILYVLNSPLLLKHMDSKKVDVARANLSLKDVSNFPILLPPLTEQQEIVRRAEKLFGFTAQIEVRYNKAKAQIDKLEQSILAKAFRGELV